MARVALVTGGTRGIGKAIVQRLSEDGIRVAAGFSGNDEAAQATAKALADRPWLVVEWMPRYAPELNPIERTWRDLKRHHLAHRTFRDTADLDRAVHQAVAEMNQERTVTHPCHNLPRAA